MLDSGLQSQERIEVLFAKRVVRTLIRIDEVEMVLLVSLSNLDRSLSGVRFVDLASESRVQDVNIVRSGLAVLSGEGLVALEGGKEEKVRLSDYGQIVLREFKQIGRRGR